MTLRNELTQVHRIEVIEDEGLYAQYLDAHERAEGLRTKMGNERVELMNLQKERGKAKGRARRIDELNDSLAALNNVPSVVRASDLLAEMVCGLQSLIDDATVTVQEFADELLTDNPVYAISWRAESVVEAVTRRTSAAKLIEDFTRMHSDDWYKVFEYHIDDAVGRVMRQACSPGSRSTSVMSNFVDDIENSVYAKMCESWRYTPMHKALADYEWYSTRQVGVIFEDRDMVRIVEVVDA